MSSLTSCTISSVRTLLVDEGRGGRPNVIAGMLMSEPFLERPRGVLLSESDGDEINASGESTRETENRLTCAGEGDASLAKDDAGDNIRIRKIRQK